MGLQLNDDGVQVHFFSEPAIALQQRQHLKNASVLFVVQIWHVLFAARLAAWVHLIMLTGLTCAQGSPQTHSFKSLEPKRPRFICKLILTCCQQLLHSGFDIFPTKTFG